MVIHMKTTLMIDDEVMGRVRVAAAQQQRTISELVEAALRLLLVDNTKVAKHVRSKLPTFDGGGAFVDIADRDALYRAMEGR